MFVQKDGCRLAPPDPQDDRMGARPASLPPPAPPLGDPLIIGLPHRRLPALLAVALSLGAIAVLLALPCNAIAKTRKGRCSSSTAHLKHAGHACSSHRHKAAIRHTGKGRHAVHRGSAPSAKARTAPRRRPGSGAASGAATCEDGTEAAPGSVTCANGGEAICEDGSSPVRTGEGGDVVCPPSSEAEAGTSEPACEENGTGPCGSSEASANARAASCLDGKLVQPAVSGHSFCSDGSGPSCLEEGAASLSSVGPGAIC
jgi:hypothetical protein